MVVFAFEFDIALVGLRLKCRGRLEVGRVGHDAEHTAQARHALAVGPMWSLSGLLDDVEDCGLAQLMDGQPIKPGSTGAAVALIFGEDLVCEFGALAALLGT